MNIKARGIIDNDSIKTLYNVSIHKKRNPKVVFIVSILIVFALIALNAITSLIAYGGIYLDFSILLTYAMLFFLILWINVIFPLIFAGRMKRIYGTVNEYEFCDDGFTVKTKTDEFSGESQVKYKALSKAFETSEYLILLMPNNSAYCVLKSSFEGNDLALLIDRLKSEVTKYYICKY